VWSRERHEAERYAEEMRAALDIRCDIARDVHHALQDADIAVTTTPSTTPLIEAADLHPGLHITAMGSDAEHKNEIAPAVLAAAHYVCDRLQQTRVLGELHHAIESGTVARDAVFAELGQVIAGQRPGRASHTDITLCDLTGTGAQDTAIAALAVARAQAAGAGTPFRNDTH
jgi:ornithine cyclodeaminase